MITDADVSWLELESHDWRWDNGVLERAEWKRRNDEVTGRLRDSRRLFELFGRYVKFIVEYEGVDFLDYRPSVEGTAFTPAEVNEIRDLAAKAAGAK
jgi:hypothetical protein